MVKVSEQKANVVREFEAKGYGGRAVVVEMTRAGYLCFRVKRSRTQYVVHLSDVFTRTVRQTVAAERRSKKQR